MDLNNTVSPANSTAHVCSINPACEKFSNDTCPEGLCSVVEGSCAPMPTFMPTMSPTQVPTSSPTYSPTIPTSSPTYAPTDTQVCLSVTMQTRSYGHEVSWNVGGCRSTRYASHTRYTDTCCLEPG